MLSRPGHGLEHIDEGSSAVRALAFEGRKFSLESLGARRPLTSRASMMTALIDAHIGALTYALQFNIPTLANLGWLLSCYFLIRR